MSEWIHVHRAADWYESTLDPIPETEWRACVARSDDLAEEPHGEVRWTRHPDGVGVLLVWEDGRISTADADSPTRVRLAALALELRGLLQGDGSDLYGPDGEPVDDERDDHWVAADPNELPDDVPERDAWDEAVADANPWDPSRPRSRGELLRGIFRRE